MATSILRVLIAAAACLSYGSRAQQDAYLRDAAARGEPVQAIYSDDLADPWNRLFSAMFTRAVRHRKTSEFADAGPFTKLGERSFTRYPVSTRIFERLEDGDRAAAPFYPSFMTAAGITRERLAGLEQLLIEAAADTRPRSAIDRALMQADLWAVFDRLASFDPRLPNRARYLGPEADRVMPLLAQTMARLALTRGEIAALPDQYAAARRTMGLPDLFSPAGGWHEIVWFDRRTHDDDVSFRQATRVFIRPASSVVGLATLLSELRGLGSGRDYIEGAHARGLAALANVDGVALVMQMLAIDRAGEIVPTPLVFTVQTRMFGSGNLAARAVEHELSRRLLRARPDSGGMRTFRDADPGYVPSAGNDYSFASPHSGTVREPILGTLATRCSACHGSGAHMFTFSVHYAAPAPPVTILSQPNDTRGRFVADKKKAREDYKRLRALWSR